MTVNELYGILDTAIPRSLSCSWDNDGLMLAPDGHKKIDRALVCLDVTGDVVEKAIEENYDVIISHHPFIFSGLKCVTEGDFIARKALKLIKRGISVMSFHTRLDAVDGGVNDTLASLFGLTDVEKFGKEGEEIGRVGYLPEEMELSDFAALVKQKLSADVVTFAGRGRKVSRVAVLGGGGDDFVGDAIRAGADTYLTGTLSYHDLADADDNIINLIEAGHFFTEHPVCEMFAKTLRDMGIDTDVYNSNRIRTI